MKKLRGNQSFYFIFLALNVLLLIVIAIIQTYYDTKYHRIDIYDIYSVLFVLSLFLTERYRLYYVNAFLFLLAFLYLIVDTSYSFFDIEWTFEWLSHIVVNLLLMVLLYAFVQYPIKIIKFGKRFKKSI